MMLNWFSIYKFQLNKDLVFQEVYDFASFVVETVTFPSGVFPVRIPLTTFLTYIFV